MRSFSVKMEKWSLLLCTVFAYKNKSLTLYIITCLVIECVHPANKEKHSFLRFFY